MKMPFDPYLREFHRFFKGGPDTITLVVALRTDKPFERADWNGQVLVSEEMGDAALEVLELYVADTWEWKLLYASSKGFNLTPMMRRGFQSKELVEFTFEERMYPDV